MHLSRLLPSRAARSYRTVAAMSTASIATLQRMSAQTLSEKLLEESEASDPTLAVVDVRDDDYIGGHIKGAAHVPSRQLDVMMPTLVRRLKDKKTVVFHCALSQQRGPAAALRYLRERDGLLARLGESEGLEAEKDGVEGVAQAVYVLDRGFQGWQEVYGEDTRLTEGYRKELWQDY